MSQLNICLFGGFQAKMNEQRIELFRSNKVRALLAYLIIENGVPIARKQLHTLLWDGYTTEAAQTNLRASLMNLRRLLAPFDLLESSRFTVCLKSNSPALRCDVIVLQQLSEDKHFLEHQAWQTLMPKLQQGFLTRFPPIDSEPFEKWRALRHRAYQQQVAQIEYAMTGRIP